MVSLVVFDLTGCGVGPFNGWDDGNGGPADSRPEGEAEVAAPTVLIPLSRSAIRVCTET